MEFRLNSKFNPEFIRNNRIAEIRCKVESKKDGDKIRNTNREEVYHFYENGNLKMISHINNQLQDTSITFFEYTQGRLECEVKNDAAGMFSYCYEYDKNERPITLRYGRAERFNSLTASLDMSMSSEITAESYEYLAYENQLHATLRNSSGRPYLKEIRYFDENGYLEKYLKTYIIGSSRHEENYKYNARGWLSEKAISDGDNFYKLTYTYDAVGNLEEERKYIGEELKYRKEYVYNAANMFLTAELKREDENELIVITTYTYKFQK